MVKFDKIVPDTSVIIDGLLSNALREKKISFKKIIMPEAVLSELENQANKGKDTGFRGLDEIIKLRDFKSGKYVIEYAGSRPGDFEIKFAKSGEIDSLIREVAFKENATLVTSDIVQAKVAKAKGVDFYLYFTDKAHLLIDNFLKYDKVIIRENEKVIVYNKGKKRFLKKVFDKNSVKELSSNLVDYSYGMKDFYVNYNKNGFLVTSKAHNFNFMRDSNGLSELIIVRRNIRKFKDYGLDKKVFDEDLIVVGSFRNDFLDVLRKEFDDCDIKELNGYNVDELELFKPDKVVCFDLDSFDDLRRRGFLAWCVMPYVSVDDFLEDYDVYDVNVLQVDKKVKVVKK